MPHSAILMRRLMCTLMPHSSTLTQCLTNTVSHAALTAATHLIIRPTSSLSFPACLPHSHSLPPSQHGVTEVLRQRGPLHSHSLPPSQHGVTDVLRQRGPLAHSHTLSSTVAARGCRGVPRRRGQVERSFGCARKGDGAGGPGNSGAGVAQGRGSPQSMADQCSSRCHTTDVARCLLQSGMRNSWLCLYQFNDPTTVSAKRSRIKVCSELRNYER
jgi:hypothetical protein